MARNFKNQTGPLFLTPRDLSVSNVRLNKVALIGSCLAEEWDFHRRNSPDAHVDFFLTNNNAGLPELSDAEIESYDMQIVQLALSVILRIDQLWNLRADDESALQRSFEDSCARMELLLSEKMAWNKRFGLLTLVANFMLPQGHSVGRLFPRYHLGNIEYFVAQLNERLEQITRRYRNAYLLDIDRISASLGRRHMQDDIIGFYSHGAMLPHGDAVTTRIEPLAPMTDYYPARWQAEFRPALWAEIEAIHRTVLQTDSVKMIVVDLDDTLWNGISGETEDIGVHMVEGWPLGFIEALMCLKNRGILLAIISKNEEARIRQIWPKILKNYIKLEDFAAIYINWRPKAENMAELLAGANLLPRSVVFIDDNPVERAAMQGAYPDMRIHGRDPYYLRRILLWSSETQVVSITEESSRRTEMIQAQLVREDERKQMTREEFLANAAPVVTMLDIPGVDHPRFNRCLELINKTNQYNTTGQRWTAEELGRFTKEGGRIVSFETEDAYTAYGLVGVVLMHDGEIGQWVMSCRVLGYDVEIAVMAEIVSGMRRNGSQNVRGILRETSANFPCRDLFKKCGFTAAGGDDWALVGDAEIVVPPHISFKSAS